METAITNDPLFVLFGLLILLLPYFYTFAYMFFLMLLDHFTPFTSKPPFIRILIILILFLPMISCLTFGYLDVEFNFWIPLKAMLLLCMVLILLQTAILVNGSTIVYFKSRDTNKRLDYLFVLLLTLLPLIAVIAIMVNYVFF